MRSERDIFKVHLDCDLINVHPGYPRPGKFHLSDAQFDPCFEGQL